MYSPDGTRVAFYGLADDRWDLYLMDADGSNLSNLTQDTTECYSLSWSPDGQWIAYTAGSAGAYDLWLIHVASKQRLRLTDGPARSEAPAWLRE
ncbi:Tol biopolymer transport system component [Lewinella marina]|uniref:TolB family protein n=1 Tax=Neolewinella marina TaxID=438751 RepID=UPI00169AE856|nr:DPP IV N-terminal domain-containing protein [Neolewinella marina]NJB86825.1 Tol biopolymer transport system component [Neolewinella marina]